MLGAGVVLFALWQYGRDLPDYRQLANYEPPIVTRVYGGNGQLIGEFADEKRVFVPIEVVPERVIQAFVAAEDQHFFVHPGIDVLGLGRALITNLRNLGSNRRPVGASTITQQVAKNFLLTSELSIERKIKEVILAFRIERAFTKPEILELYLNEIFLGQRSYGVAAAALTYFDKSLDDLTIAEAAYLAALPKAPNNYHPIRKYAAAKARRDYVVERMRAERYISSEEAVEATFQPIEVTLNNGRAASGADYYVEEVRRELLDRYGGEALLRGGMVVRTSVDPRLQEIADRVLRKGLVAYDRRHGWRGPLARIEPGTDWAMQLSEFQRPAGMGDWLSAVVLAVDEASAEIGTADSLRGRIPMSELTWARAALEKQKRGPKVKTSSDVLAVGDVIAVEPVAKDGKGKAYPANSFALRQIPDVQGAIVALDPHTGRVLAMSGGYSFRLSQFNRATQARRQPGSAFKPFVYLAALDNGFSPASIVLDAPVVIKSEELGKWKPENYSKRFYGPVPMRLGLEKSRNLMTVRLAQALGVGTIARYGERFGIGENLPLELGTALGTDETTPLRLTTAYAMLVNGGKRVTPSFIDRVQDRHGKTVFQNDKRRCEWCRDVRWEEQSVPRIPDDREQVGNPQSVYQVVSMLEGVVRRGTGRRVRAVGRPIAGKTGTTNEYFDAWFLGFTPDLVAGVWVGFDQPRTLGRNETGSRAASPVFTDFMKEALAKTASVAFRVPQGIQLVRINADTGEPAAAGDKRVIVEALKPEDRLNAAGSKRAGRAPTRRRNRSGSVVGSGTGGQY